MTDAASARGEAPGVEAVTGPGLPDHMLLALALREAIDADGRVEMAQRKLAKTRLQVDDAISSAADLLAAAEADARTAGGRVAGLVGGDGGQAAVEALKAAAAEAQKTYERAADLLSGSE